MTDYRYMLLSSSEDGNPVRWLDAARLRALLDDPGGFGIDRFVGPDDVQTDPNYWPSDVGILLRVEVVEPVPSGAYQLPPEFDITPEDARPMPAAATEWMMGREGPVRLDSVHDTTKPVGSFNIVSATPEGAAITLEKAYDPFRLGGVGASPLKLGDVQE